MTEQQKQIKKDFINFLKTRRLYSKFKRYYNIFNELESFEKPEKNIHCFINNQIKKDPTMLIQGAFPWTTTVEPEGLDPWLQIHNEWTAFCRKH